MTWEVQTFTVCNGWVNCWTVHEEDGTSYLETFDTPEAAQAALGEFLTEIEEEIALGIREPDTGYDPADLRIVEVQQ